ncbi:MAG: DUF2399 domain-containing protein, partial [Rectinemataceae bacterium]|nr:DUF2399 domain-containing protein [Rectinemataceae bacterium]
AVACASADDTAADASAAAERIGRLAALPGMTPEILADAALFLPVPRDEVASLPLRALSIKLYRNSKRLESILPFLVAAMDEAGRESLPERSYPEAAIAGFADLVFEDGTVWPLGGKSLSLSLETAEKIVAIRPEHQLYTLHALTVENKENFHAFARSAGTNRTLVVATGGRPNRAVRAILHLLASCGWSTRHAGDLDPDGIAILGEVHRICGAMPLMMDTETFDRYAAYAKPLPESILRRLAYLGADVVDLPGIAALVQRIAESGMSVEQEIIEY